MASKQDIARAFGRFETCGLRMPDSLIYSPAEQREMLIEEWSDLFAYTEGANFMLAEAVVLKSCKYWPKPAEMMAAVDEVKRNFTVTAKRNSENAYVKPVELDPAVRKLIADVIAHHSFAETMEIEKEVVDEARSYFPQISDTLIRQNYCEFRQLADQRKRILVDSTGRTLNGFRKVPRLTTNGFVILEVRTIENKGA